MILNLNETLDDLDKTTIKFNGSLLWIPSLNKFICAFRAIKKPFSKFIEDIPNYPYMWIDQKFWYNNLNYIGILLLNSDFSIVENTFRKYLHTFKELDLIEFESKGISYSGPEDPRLYFKSDGQPYMLYNTIIPEKLVENCKKQCVGMYEIKIKPGYFLRKCKTEELYDTSRKVVCLNVLDKLSFENKGKVHFKNLSPSNEINRDIDYLIDNFNNYKLVYKQEKNEENHICNFEENMKLNNINNIVLPENMKQIFHKELIDNIHSSLTTPEIRLEKDKEEFLGVAHIRIDYLYLVKNLEKLSESLKEFVLILNNRIKNNFKQHTDFYFMLIYLRNIQGNIISYSQPFIPQSNNIRNNVLYNVVFPCGLTRKDDDIIISYGEGDCLFNILRLKKSYIKNNLNFNKLKLQDFGIKYFKTNKKQNFSKLKKDLKEFGEKAKRLINIP